MPQHDVELILLRQWASYMAMPIWIAGGEEQLLFYNEAAELLLGRRFDEAGEMPLGELPTMFKLTAEDGSALGLDAFPLTVAHRESRPAHSRVRYQALDGTWRSVQVTAFPVEGQGGRHLGAMAIFWEAGEP